MKLKLENQVDMELHQKDSTLLTLQAIKHLELVDKVTQHTVPEKKIPPNVRKES